MNRYTCAWALMRQSAQSHADDMAAMVDEVPADMIAAEVQKFCGQAMPTTGDELRIRRIQLSDLIARIGAVSHAGLIVRLYPDRADAVFDIIRQHLNQPFAFRDDEGLDGLNQRAARLTLTISQLSQEETATVAADDR